MSDGRVMVSDIQIRVPDQSPVTAYLVRSAQPAHPGGLAGLLYLHWFEPGNPTQNRGEYLAEAVAMAGEGAVAVLPQLTFPWAGDPLGDSSDRAKVTAQLDAVVSAYQTLVSQPDVDPRRTAVIGHDYGAMYGAFLAQRDPRVRAMVFMAGDTRWATWFDTYWLGLPDERKAAYRDVFAGLDPIDNVSRLGSRLYFQWAGRDRFVSDEIRAAFRAGNPSGPVSVYERAEHFLNQQARNDRDLWVRAQVGIG